MRQHYKNIQTYKNATNNNNRQSTKSDMQQKKITYKKHVVDSRPNTNEQKNISFKTKESNNYDFKHIKTGSRQETANIDNHGSFKGTQALSTKGTNNQGAIRKENSKPYKITVNQEVKKETTKQINSNEIPNKDSNLYNRKKIPSGKASNYYNQNIYNHNRINNTNSRGTHNNNIVVTKDDEDNNKRRRINNNNNNRQNEIINQNENLKEKKNIDEKHSYYKRNIKQKEDKEEKGNSLEGDSQKNSNKKEFKEEYKDIPKEKENYEVKNIKSQIMKESKKDVSLKEDNQNNSNKKEIKEDYKNKQKEIENDDNKNYQSQIKNKDKEDEALKEVNQNNTNKEEVKEDNDNASKDIENTEPQSFRSHIKPKNKKDNDLNVINLLGNKTYNNNPVKVISGNNINQVEKKADNEKINDIKALVPAAAVDSKLNKKPKQRHASTYNRVVNNPEVNTEEIIESNPKTIIKDFCKPGLIGLKNVGATCYMNSTLQCFSNCPSFKNTLLKLYKKLENGKDSKYRLSFALAEVLKNLWEHHKFYEPHNFKNIISELNPIFKGIAANDPKDLVLFIIQKIHNELNEPNPNKETNDGNNNPYDFWSEYFSFMKFYKNQNNSIITDEFHFYTNNMTTCCNCNTTIHNVQTNNILFFPLEEVRRFKGYFKNIVSIYDCFEYNERQTQESFHCNSCNNDCYGYSMTKMVLSSKTLIINLNRGHGMEFDVKIVFEEYLNIRRFVYMKESPYYYELTGVICHFGDNDDSGHFIAYCKNCNDCNWYKFNDRIITKCSFTDVCQKGMHYVLFYSYVQGED